MKKKASKTKKKMTIEDLARVMRLGFNALDKKLSGKINEKINNLDEKLTSKIDESVNSLAIMTAKSFKSIDNRFEKIDERFNGIENRFENLELGQKKIHQEILNVYDNFAKKSDLDISNQRISRVEQKLKIKSK